MGQCIISWACGAGPTKWAVRNQRHHIRRVEDGLPRQCDCIIIGGYCGESSSVVSAWGQPSKRTPGAVQ